MNGSVRRARGATCASMASKLLAIILSVAMATMVTPLYAWANDAPTDESAFLEDAGGTVPDGTRDCSGESNNAPIASEAPSHATQADDSTGLAASQDLGAAGGDDSSSIDTTAPAVASPSAAQSADSVPAASTPDAQSAESVASVSRDSSLSDAVAALQDENWRLELVYGQDRNANDVLKAKLASMGVEGVDVRVTQVEYVNRQEKSDLGISIAADDTNGDITYFFMDPDDVTGFWANYVQWCQVKPTFTLMRGDESVTFAPSRATSVPWDEDKVLTMLSNDAQSSLTVGFATGDSADAVTQNMTLPNKMEGKSWSEVTWKSSDEDVIKITGYSWDDESVGNVVRPSVDTQVTLTATVGVVTSGGPEVTVDVPFTVTVKADPQAIEDAKAVLQEKVDAAFTTDKLVYSADGSSVDADAVTGDLQLPRTSAIGIDGKYYTVEYSASNDAIQVSGYRGNVYQPLPGASESSVELTLTVTSKENPEIAAAKTIELSISPLAANDIEAELALMDEAKANYAAALLNGQSADAVTGDLSTFQKAYRGADGSLSWARTSVEADAAGAGIVADDLEPDDDMGVVAGHWFKSSDSAVMAHDTLLVIQPEYDTQVTVVSSLSSEKYARYIERYADDAQWGATFSQLAGQRVSATVTVTGSKGAESPDVEASVTIVGVDAFGEDQVWVSNTAYILGKGSTVADLIEAALADADFAHEATGVGTEDYYLSTVTSPDGRVLGWDAETGKYWQVFVNGAATEVGAGQVPLQPGDSIALYYSAYGASPDDIGKAKITVAAQIIGPDGEGADASWMGLTELSLPQGSMAADLTERALALAGLEADTGTGSYGWFLNSITSPYTGEALGTVEAASGEWLYWQLFVNGEASDLGAGSVALKPGDQVTWYYSSYGAKLPENEIEVNPDAWDMRPSDWEAEWNGSASGALENVATPTEGGELAWSIDLGSDVDTSIYASDPIIVNGRVYVAVGDELRAYDATTGEQIVAAKLATAINSVSRMLYADGVIVVPLDGGRLQVLTADTLTTVSLTEKLAQGQQSLSSLVVKGGYAYFGVTDGGGAEGAYYCVNLRTGAVAWSADDAGNYWTGAVIAGDCLITVDNAGTVRVRDAQTGEVAGSLELGGTVRARLAADPDDSSAVYAVTSDGALHRIALGAQGSLAITGSVHFAASSTSTPAIVGGRAFVGGSSAEFTGVLAVVDLSSMTVEHTITGFSNGAMLPGDVKSTPTVSERNGETYAYFTCNASGGAAYLYRLGDAYAHVLYQPEDAQSGYTMASVAAGADGSLYYVNDGGFLFKLTAGSTIADPELPGGGQANGEGNASGGSQLGSGDDGWGGSANASSQTWGTVAAGMSPLSSRSSESAAQSASPDDDAAFKAGSEAVAHASSRAGAADGASVTSLDASQESGSAAIQNAPVWAFVGLGAGTVCLIAAGLWLFATRRFSERGM